MRRTSARSDGVISPAAHQSRSSSISSSITSPASKYNRLYAAPSANPPPAYISPEGAYETIATSYTEKAAGEDEDPVTFSEGAVSQINSFLDYLLYNFLSIARSSTLAQIRPAVEAVVKGRLAQQAIASADEELSDLLDGGEDDDETAVARKEQDPATAWELEPVWKRTRLRIMVYVRLGNMEDDDEERYVEEEQLHNSQEASEHRFSQRSGLVSWAALIFLTAVLELIAEQCVKDAVHFASARVSISRPNLVYEDDNSSAEPLGEPLTIKENDVRKLGLSPTLGRIWRTWKKSNPKASPQIVPGVWRPYGRESRLSPSVSEFSSNETGGTARSTLSVAEDLPGDLPIDAEKQTVRGSMSGEAASKSSVPRGGVRRSRSTFTRFPVLVANAHGGSWKPRFKKPVQTTWARRARSSSLPTPVTSFWSPPAFRQKTEESESKPVDDMSPRAGITTVGNQVRDETKDESEDAINDQNITKDRSEPVNDLNDVDRAGDPHGSYVETIPAAESEPRETFLEEPGSALTADEPITRDVSPSSASKSAPVDHIQALPQSAASLEDDEYDPFRADLAPPPPRSTASKTSSPTASAQGTPVDVQPNALDRSVGRETHDDATSAAIVAGAASTAILGSSAQMMKKKEKSIENVQEHNELRSVEGRPSTPVRPFPTTAQDVKSLSPLKMNAVKPSDLEHKSSPPEKRNTSSDSGSQYETPPRSPIASLVTSNATKTSSNEKPAVRMQPSPPAIPLKPVDSRKAGVPLNKIVTNGSIGKERSSSNMSAGSATSERDFNALVSGNETVKRSLTPRNLVDIEQPDSPRLRQAQFEQTKELLAEEVPQMPNNNYTSQPMRRKDEPQIPPQPMRGVSKGTKSGLLARDARVQTAPTSELADYLRSTAPSKPQPEPIPFVPSTPTIPLTSKAGLVSGQTSRQPTAKNSLDNVNQRAGPFSGNKLKSLAGPRTARVERQANEDLISFLNAGPPGAQISKKRSMETNGSRSDYPMTVSSANRSSSQTSQSYQDSINSHSALLSKMPNGVSKPAPEPRNGPNGASSRPTGASKSTVEGPPARKQRRVKDPYAIDSDDEGSDILTGLREDQGGESLMDFLRNSGPEAKEDKSPASAARRQPTSTTTTVVSGPYTSKPVPIASNESIKASGGVASSTSAPALPDFLKDSRTPSSRPSVDEGKKGRSSSGPGAGGKGGMRSLFSRKKSAVNA